MAVLHPGPFYMISPLLYDCRSSSGTTEAFAVDASIITFGELLTSTGREVQGAAVSAVFTFTRRRVAQSHLNHHSRQRYGELKQWRVGC